MIGVFEAQSRQNSVPRAAAADLTKKDSPSTTQSKLGKPTDKCAIVRETQPGNSDAFAKMISEYTLSLGFEHARLQLRKPQQQHCLLTHKNGKVLEEFTSSDTFLNLGGKLSAAGVRDNRILTPAERAASSQAKQSQSQPPCVYARPPP